MTKLMSLESAKNLINFGSDLEADYGLLSGWLLNSEPSELNFELALADCIDKAKLIISKQSAASAIIVHRYAHAVVALSVADNFMEKAGPSRRAGYAEHRSLFFESTEELIVKKDLDTELKSRIIQFGNVARLRDKLFVEIDFQQAVLDQSISASFHLLESLKLFKLLNTFITLQNLECLVLKEKLFEAKKACDFAIDVVNSYSDILDRVTFNSCLKKMS